MEILEDESLMSHLATNLISLHIPVCVFLDETHMSLICNLHRLTRLQIDYATMFDLDDISCLSLLTALQHLQVCHVSTAVIVLSK